MTISQQLSRGSREWSGSGVANVGVIRRIRGIRVLVVASYVLAL